MFNKIKIVLELNDHTTKTLIGFKLNQIRAGYFWNGTVIIIVIYYYNIILYYF